MASTIIIVLGFLAMLVCFAGAYWLWFHDPPWPWTQARPSPALVAAAAPASPPPAAAEVDESRTDLLPTSAPVDPEHCTTLMYEKPATPPKSDATQILPDPEYYALLQRDEDAPSAVSDQLQTQPLRRAFTPRRR